MCDSKPGNLGQLLHLRNSNTCHYNLLSLFLTSTRLCFLSHPLTIYIPHLTASHILPQSPSYTPPRPPTHTHTHTLSFFLQSQEQLVELQNGCICCSLRVDLVAAIARLAAAGAFDLLLLESTGVSEPLQVAEIFAVDVPIDQMLVEAAPAASNNGGSSGGGSNGVPAAAEAAATAVTAAAGGDSSAAAAVLLRDVAYLDTAVGALLCCMLCCAVLCYHAGT